MRFKFVTILLLLFTSLNLSFSQDTSDKLKLKNGHSVEYFESENSGKIKVEGDYNNGKKEGVWKYFNVGDTLLAEINFRNDMRYGKAKYYYENGDLKSTGSFEKDQSTGEWIEWDNDKYLGKTYWKGEYSNGDRIGTWKMFFESGKKYGTGQYENGQRSGKWIFWYENGNKMSEGYYVDSKYDGKYEDYYKSGEICSNGYFIKGRKEGPWIEYEFIKSTGDLVKNYGVYKFGERDSVWVGTYKNGNRYSEISYKYGKIDGILTIWFENGNKIVKSEFKNGLEDGKSLYYAKDGSLILEAEYKFGKLNGKYLEIVEDSIYGEIRKEGEYIDNEMNGTWKHFTKSGKKIFEGDFVNNRAEGIHTFYFTNGELKSKGKFVRNKRDSIWVEFQVAEVGVIKWEGEYKNNRKNGKWTCYYENGVKYAEGNFENGLAKGEWLIWDEYGVLSQRIKDPSELKQETGDEDIDEE